jgi:glycosyltransferase involved in cell wall biosynthesis
MNENSRPRLLIVGPLPPPFIGPAIATERLVASHVINEAFDVALLDTSDPGGEEDIGRFTMHNVTEALAQVRSFWRAIFARRPDVIYISIARGFWGFLRDFGLILPSRLLGMKVVIHLRAGRFDIIHDNGMAGRLLARWGLACVTYAAVLGETTRDIFGPYISSDRVKVVPNGIDLDAWPAPDSEPGREESFRILYLANLFRDKGAHVMLQALPRIVREEPNARVTFAGGWYDDRFREYCMELVHANGLEPYVEFVGVVKGDEKKRLLRSADLVVFVPVAPEGSPWVVLEAMASGRPVIGTPQGTMREVIVDGETGYLIEPENPDLLAKRVLTLMHDRDRLRAMGRAGRDRVERVYSEEQAHGALVQVMEGGRR